MAFLMKTTVIKIRTASVIESASEMSSSHGGSGMIRTTMISTRPRAKPRSPRFKLSTKRRPMSPKLTGAAPAARCAACVIGAGTLPVDPACSAMSNPKVSGGCSAGIPLAPRSPSGVNKGFRWVIFAERVFGWAWSD